MSYYRATHGWQLSRPVAIYVYMIQCSARPCVRTDVPVRDNTPAPRPGTQLPHVSEIIDSKEFMFFQNILIKTH